MIDLTYYNTITFSDQIIAVVPRSAFVKDIISSVLRKMKTSSTISWAPLFHETVVAYFTRLNVSLSDLNASFQLKQQILFVPLEMAVE